LLMSLTIFVENVGSVDFNITDFDLHSRMSRRTCS
jgi:hypothetical protein